MPNLADSQNWLLDEFSAQLASVLDAMTGQRPVVERTKAEGRPSSGLLWQQQFSGLPGAIWLSAADSDVKSIGTYVQRAAGMEDQDADGAKSTYVEILGQVVSGLGQCFSGKLDQEITPQDGAQKEWAAVTAASSPIQWARVEFPLADSTAAIWVGVEEALLGNLVPADNNESALSGTGKAEDPLKTFDLLLDVELPVSISFGRAQVPLKDVLQLTTGSIIELDRAVAEPVDLIVNNCVIARGEVVVVDGNFGVRIQHVVSRQERLRTLR